MEGSESEEVFQKLNLNPQLFVTEVSNRVDDLVDGAFDYFHQEASRLLKTDDAKKYEDLKLGINNIRSTIQASLDKRLDMWERYCLFHCFSVPSGFSLPSENEAAGDDSMDQDVNDEQVDTQLDSLRNKLVEAGKECCELNHELRELEANSAWTNHCTSAVNEAMQLYGSNSTQDVFQEILKSAAELRQKMYQLKTKQKQDIEHSRREKEDIQNGDFSIADLSNFKSEDLQAFIAEINL